MAEKLEQNSYLKFSSLFNVDGVLFWDVPDFPVIEQQSDDLVYTVQSGDSSRIDLIAFDIYGDAELWWVILLANNLQLITDLTVGQILTIPSPRYIKSVYLNQVRR